MKKIRNFECEECEDVFTRLVADHVKVVNCECKGKANRTLSAPRCFQNTVGKSPSRR